MRFKIVLYVFIFSLIFSLVISNAKTVFALTDISTSSSITIPPMVEEESISTFIPSKVAPGQGIAVNVLYPNKPRYKEGAPVIVVVPSEEIPSGIDFSMHAAQSGFVEVRFAYPGTGKKGYSSSGIYDMAGINCQTALKDVIEFASGKTTDVKGKKLSAIVPVKVYNPSIGLVGWSNGGNIILAALAKWAQELSCVSFVTFYESPVGSLFYPPCLGSAYDYITNRHYRLGSAATGKCLVDFRKLCFDAVTVRKSQFNKKIGQSNLPGILFFDENNNKQWDEALEFALPYLSDIGLEKQIYSPQITKALLRLKVFGDNWPSTVASLNESQAYFDERDGSLFISDVCKKMPNLMVVIFGSTIDHLQRQSDHGHICLQYNNWLEGKIAFVRLNPDPLYVGMVGDMSSHNFVSNLPNSSLDASAMEEYLEPEGLLPDYVYMEAAISELADRKYFNNLNSQIEKPLTIYDNGASKSN
jgi:hypothetical protein